MDTMAGYTATEDVGLDRRIDHERGGGEHTNGGHDSRVRQVQLG